KFFASWPSFFTASNSPLWVPPPTPRRWCRSWSRAKRARHLLFPRYAGTNHASPARTKIDNRHSGRLRVTQRLQLCHDARAATDGLRSLRQKIQPQTRDETAEGQKVDNAAHASVATDHQLGRKRFAAIGQVRRKYQ